MGRLKKLLNLLVLAVAGIVIWHEYIEPQRRSAADSGKPGGTGDSDRGGGTSPWDGVPSARDIVKSVTGDASGSGPASEGLAAAIAAINTVTERVTAVADELASRRSEGSDSEAGSEEASDPRQLSSPTRFKGAGADAGDEAGGKSGSSHRDEAASSATSDSSSGETAIGSDASGTATGAVADTAGDAGSGVASGSGTEAVANTVADAVPVDAEATEDGSAPEDASAADDRASDGGPASGGAAIAAFADGELEADIATATSTLDTGTDAGTPVTGAGAAPQDDEDSANEASRTAGAGTEGADSAARAGAGAAPVSVPAGAVQGDGTADCPDEYPIKGNATSRIYHEPGRASYDRTIPEFCFDSIEAAEAAGFRAPKH